MSDRSARVDGAGMLAEPLCAGPGPGRLGVVAARAGVGKSTCLVRLALTHLVRGEPVLHVSLDTMVSHVRAAYDAKLDALRELDPSLAIASLRFEVERRRIIHSYRGAHFTPEKLDEALGFLAEHVDFRPTTVVLDGFSFAEPFAEQVDQLRQIVAGVKAELWMSAQTHRNDRTDPSTGLPASLAWAADLTEVVLNLEPSGQEILVHRIVPGQARPPEQLPVKLDPATMLLVGDKS